MMEIAGAERIERQGQRTTKYRLPGTERRVDYVKYSKITHECEICGHGIAGHPKCPACNILCEGAHEQSLSSYRGKQVCGPCQKAWQVLDKLLGRQSTWDEFAKEKRPQAPTHTPTTGGAIFVVSPRAKKVNLNYIIHRLEACANANGCDDCPDLSVCLTDYDMRCANIYHEGGRWCRISQ